jgi:hypothetical protein
MSGTADDIASWRGMAEPFVTQRMDRETATFRNGPGLLAIMSRANPVAWP